MSAYYNDNDRACCAWMRELARRGLIADGTVDERSIRELRGADLAGYERVHLFAGIGGWDYSLRMAGWPDGRPVWTGSAPCQPFSSAGKQQGIADERHLWPEMLRLIAECRPPVVFGEQVASRLGRDWLTGVRTDLEALGYAVGAASLGAHSVGAPHMRQRLYWVAVAGQLRVRGGRLALGGTTQEAEGAGQERQRLRSDARNGRPTDSGLAIAGRQRLIQREEHDCQAAPHSSNRVAHMGHAFWSDFVWLPCRDGKSRRIEPGLAPLAHGVPARVVRLRGYGNGIVAPLAATLIQCVMEIIL